MSRSLAAAFAVAGLLVGCTGGEDDGTLDPSVLRRTADHATFHVRVPDLGGGTYRLLNVGSTAADERLQSVSYDVVDGHGHLLSVEQAGSSHVGIIRVYTKGATPLGSERIGELEWRVYSQPSVGGVVYVHTYPDGVEAAVFGGADRPAVRALAGSLRT